ncbi:hypothetical protein MFLO_10688 [Listeria floridensis FSL S10-1187]|uniref:FNG domain-containing protein n=1 Tax=Listeria floridensis FSL S10-1187 TaxID=1265817 RepID=A0ABN0RDS8_9LIST|nr:hypothetical protein [Listeria floridensis]EUJ30283.1 hypothetical protein MFLO_10688 [Listeria floridensis FSL S10-1187]
MRRSNKLLKIIATGLLATTTLTSLPIYNGTADAKKLPKAKSAMSARAVDPKNTIASGWNVLKYSSDLNVSLNDTFVQNRPVIDGNGLVLDTAYINFANIGNSVFKAQHVFHMKKRKNL